MSADRETTRVVRSWLAEGATALPDRVLDTVLDQLPATPQRRSWWPSRRLFQMNRGAVAIATAVVVVVVGIIGLNSMPTNGGPGPSGSARVSPPGPSEPTRATFLNGAQVDPDGWGYVIGRHEENVDGIPFSVNIPAFGWEVHGPNGTPMPALDGLARVSINRSYHGPQGAEAMIYWTSPVDARYTDPCDKVLGRSADGPIAELASVLAAAPGTDLVSGPTDVTLGGRPAKSVVVTVREDKGCSPGYFFSWDQYHGGALWTGTEVGDTIRVWIVDVDGRHLFIGAETHADAQAESFDRDVLEIVDSIQFE